MVSSLSAFHLLLLLHHMFPRLNVLCTLVLTVIKKVLQVLFILSHSCIKFAIDTEKCAKL
jgi:hypothetical protein